MVMKWNHFEFAYTEHEDGLAAPVLKNVDVIIPGGKTVSVKKGDMLFVDKRGREVTVIEKKKAIPVKPEVPKKETVIEKVKNYAKTSKAKAKTEKTKTVLSKEN